MIGQNRLKKYVYKLIDKKQFPRFCIISGVEGSGKKTLCRDMQNNWKDVLWCVEPDNKIETVRNAILDAYKAISPTVYVFYDVDNMSIQAKNALLKVTEEPPNNAYFIMTITDELNTLETIRSRATIFAMDNYTSDELYEYATLVKNYDTEAWAIIQSICEVPGEINAIGDVHKFYEFVEKVIDNIASASGSNVFKLSEHIKMKDDSVGYDMKLFFKTVIRICFKRGLESMDDFIYYSEGAKVTSRYLSELGITGISKQSLMDIWILDMRKVWM